MNRLCVMAFVLFLLLNKVSLMRMPCRHPNEGSPLCPNGYICKNICQCPCECPKFRPSICCPPSKDCRIPPMVPTKQTFLLDEGASTLNTTKRRMFDSVAAVKRVIEG